MARQVVFIMTDTTRKDMVGCYGNKDMITPNLDALARDGIRYENCYSCQPVCGPARSAIFTGKYPHTNGMVTNSVALRDNMRTIGEFLSDHNIHSAYVGKWHLDGWDYFGTGKCAKGYDPEYWYDMRDYLDELTPEERVYSRQRDSAYDPELKEDFLYAHRCSNRAMDFLDKHGEEDYFLTVSYDEPHGPSLCPAPYNHMYDGYCFPDSPAYADTLENKPFMQRLWSAKDYQKSPEQLRTVGQSEALLLGCNSYVDYEIGRVIDKIKEKSPEALIIYTSDHGDMLGAHRLYSKNSAAYKEIANVPYIISGGSSVLKERGIVTDKMASHIDIAPTVLDYFGIEIPKTFEGHSILEQIKNPEISVHDESYVEFTRYEVDHDGFGGLQMMRTIVTQRYKLVIHLLDTDELYDIQEDPAEVNNLIQNEKYASIRNLLHDRLLQHMNDTRDLYRGYQWACRPWRKDLIADWENDGCSRQREEEPGEERQLDYDTGMAMVKAVRHKKL